MTTIKGDACSQTRIYHEIWIGDACFKHESPITTNMGDVGFKKRVSYKNQYGRRVSPMTCTIRDAVKHVFNVVYVRLLLTHFGDAVYKRLLSCGL